MHKLCWLCWWRDWFSRTYWQSQSQWMVKLFLEFSFSWNTEVSLIWWRKEVRRKCSKRAAKKNVYWRTIECPFIRKVLLTTQSGNLFLEGVRSHTKLSSGYGHEGPKPLHLTLTGCWGLWRAVMTSSEITAERCSAGCDKNSFHAVHSLRTHPVPSVSSTLCLLLSPSHCPPSLPARPTFAPWDSPNSFFLLIA